MPLPVVPNNTVVQTVIRGFAQQPQDLENVLYWLYQTGLTPTPGGVSLDTLATNIFVAWTGLFQNYVASNAGWLGVTIREVDSFTGLGGARYKIGSTLLWTILQTQVGAIAGESLPAFAAYNIEKRITAAGRGRQGHVRVWGIPESFSNGDTIGSTPLTAMNSELFFTSPFFLVGGVGNTDNVALGVIDGKKINTNPSLASPAYFQPLQGLVASQEIGSQVTRKFLRRRR